MKKNILFNCILLQYLKTSFQNGDGGVGFRWQKLYDRKAFHDSQNHCQRFSHYTIKPFPWYLKKKKKDNYLMWGIDTIITWKNSLTNIDNYMCR